MKRNLPHIKISNPTARIKFTTPQSGSTNFRSSERNRLTHGKHITEKLKQAWQDSDNELATIHSQRAGAYIEFQSALDCDIAIKSLEDLKKGIRLCNVRKEIDEEEKSTDFITVFVPNNQKHIYFDKIKKYLTAETKNGKPKNKQLIEGIEDLRKAQLIESFWTDDKSLIPGNDKEWCEVWLRSTDEETVARFNSILDCLKLEKKEGEIKFPERIVKLVYTSRSDLADISKNSDDIAEYRKSQATADFFLSQKPVEQSEWVDSLLNRLVVNTQSKVSICLLDTGVNNGHPLISPILKDSDCHSVNPEWGTDDHNRHGTLMAGLLVYGNLQDKLESSNSITVGHCLESVKMLPRSLREKNAVELWGDITKQAISRAEIQAIDRRRIICIATSAIETRDRGRPSSWSASLDQIISGTEDGERRLIVIAAGNTDPSNWGKYPDSNITDSVHDPAQSWNALTVGAYTDLEDIRDKTYKEYQVLAKRGELSPFSTTSTAWEDKWPFKPDVVFEGGNLAIDNSKFVTECSDLSLLSIYYKPHEKSFCEFNMTSAAAAQAAHFAAQIQIQYPDYWPETVRGLIVHSARWTEALKTQFAEKDNKAELKQVLRACGYGVPDLTRALYCASNSLTLIVESEIQPFEKKGTSYSTKEMHLYELPWPKEILEELGEADVEMRVTLSYFIEPGPGEIGWKDRYRYASHLLRFDLNFPEEDKNSFVKRINKSAREENEINAKTGTSSDCWLIGPRNRNKGSIHSDIWQGTAAALASSNLIAISPRIGWWRERKNLKKYNEKTRYSLIVSISTPSNAVDIYTPVQIKLSQSIPTSIE